MATVNASRIYANASLRSGEPLPLHSEPPAILLSSVSVLAPCRANLLFKAMAAERCRRRGICSPCIPFSFPEDGCHARAHRMCALLLKEHDVCAGKIWLFGDPYPRPATLHPSARHNPRVPLLWRYHVAPFIQVQTKRKTKIQVIDPALFAAPVSKAVWKAAQRDPKAKFDFTDASVYDRPESGEVYEDADFSATPRDLSLYRALLRQRLTRRPASLGCSSTMPPDNIVSPAARPNFASRQMVRNASPKKALSKKAGDKR